MKKNELYSYVSDFLSTLYFKKNFLDRISSIALFGSAARGDFDKESDIDIFIGVISKGSILEIEQIVKDAINEFELKAREVWHIRGIKSPIKCIVGVLSDEAWNELRKEIESYGILFYGRLKTNTQSLESYSLFEYSLRDFKQKKRVAFQRQLLGYKSKKKKKVFSRSGLIEQLQGAK